MNDNDYEFFVDYPEEHKRLIFIEAALTLCEMVTGKRNLEIDLDRYLTGEKEGLWLTIYGLTASEFATISEKVKPGNQYYRLVESLTKFGGSDVELMERYGFIEDEETPPRRTNKSPAPYLN